MAEGLLHDDSLPKFAGLTLYQQTRATQVLHDLSELAWRSGQVAKYVAPKSLVAQARQLAGQLLVSFRIRKIALAIGQVFAESLPLRRVHFLGARELLQGLFQFFPPDLVGLLSPGEPNDAQRRRQLLLDEQMVELLRPGGRLVIHVIRSDAGLGERVLST